MAKCLKPNFSANQYSGDINLTKLTGETPEALVEEIITRLKGLPFSTSIDESNNESQYIESISQLLDNIMQKLKGTPMELTTGDKISIRAQLKSKLLPRPLTQVEQRITAIIDGTDLITEDQRRAISYRSILNDFYGTSNLGVDQWRQLRFTEQMQLRTIIDPDKRLIIDSNDTLAEGIIDYQNQQYKIIRDYLLKYVFTNPEDSKLFSQTLYITSPKTGIKNKVSTYTNALQAMYNIIEDKKRKKTLTSEIEQGWTKAIANKTDDFYEAVSAYINLTYFDDVLKESLGDFMTINEDMDSPVSAELNQDNKYEVKYKYILRKGNTNNKKNYGDDVQDSIDLMSKFSQVIINAIPIYDYRTGQREFGKMQPKDFIGTWSRLKDVGTRVADDEFVKAVNNLHDETSRLSGNLRTIYNKLFNDRHNATLLKRLNELGFDQNNLNILYSFYRTVMYGKNSWLSIENEYAQTKGIKSRYNLVESLFSIISSNTSMNYLETTFDIYTQQYVTKVKDKYSISQSRFDIVRDINDTIIDRQDSLDYRIVPQADQKSYFVNINGKNYFININSSTHLLAKKASLNSFNTPELNNLNIDISTAEKRERLINRDNLNNEELEFINILNFIDTMLNTSFGKDTQGMLEFYLSSLSDSNFLKGTFLTASRALLTKNIYDKFRKAKKEDGNPYARTELRQYLKDNPEVYPIKIANYTESRDVSEFFMKKYDGYQLKTVLDRENWVMTLAKIRTILAGNTSKSVISNLDGDKIPNFSPTFRGAEVKYQIAKSAEAVQFASANLLFSKNQTSLIEMVEDTDVKTKEGKTKQIKSMTEGELLYHSLVNRFLIPLISNNTVYIQPTVYSDKTKFVAGHIDLKEIQYGNESLDTIITSDSMQSTIEQMMIDTIGKAYEEVYNRVVEDYQKIFPGSSINEIARKLKGLNENQLIQLVKQHNTTTNDNLVFYRDLHYRQVLGGKLAFNELLFEFAKNLYTPERLHVRLENEKVNYIKELLSKRVHLIYDSQLEQALKKFVPLKEIDKWVDDNGFIALARVYDSKTKTWKKIVSGTIPDGAQVEINPMLNVAFMVDNLLGNNLRFQMNGSEINHKIKALSKLNLLSEVDRHDFPNMRKLMPGWNGESITFMDLYNMIHTTIPLDESMQQTVANLSKIYDDKIYSIENLGQNAQFKRNVSMTATMTRMIPNLYGITENMHIACMNDVPASVFNFDGKVDKVDAHDGSALLIPFWSILENKSLSDNEVGTIKKPLQHYFDDRYMTATLLKYATDTITNQWMRQSEGNSNGIRLRNIFRKATRIRWHDNKGAWRFGEINLIEGCGFKDDPTIDFKEDICEGGPGLFYRDGNTHFLIYNFGLENGVYYTDEQEVDDIGKPKPDKAPQRIYHYFTDDQTHTPSTTIQNDPKLHTIDSLFELHTVLGGIYSEELNSDGNLQYSENSNYAVTQYINLVSSLKPNANPKDISINSYDQPLKRAMIHVIANNSAIKNGVGNINPLSSWYDDTDLSYITIGTDGYGIQQDSDHTADEAKMTEFSQVINSLDAGGFLHDYVKQIYEQLGQTALDLARVELDAVKEFRQTGNKSAIYDIVGRTIMANLRSGRGQAGLAEAIINNIKKKFNLSTDHALDEFKIPFSDHNIYNTILSTFVSNINRKSIKRQYPGLGTVMVPGYNLSMIYDLNGITYQYEDLIKLAYNSGFDSELTDIAAKNRDVVNQLLWSEQEKLPTYGNPEIFMPTDNVLVTFVAEKFNLKGLNTNEVEYEVTREPWAEDEAKDDNDPTKRWKDVLKIYIKGHKEFGSFDLVKDQEFGYFSVHFKTGDANTGETFGSTPEQRNILYQNLYDAIPEGAYVSTYGNISEGGLNALNKLMQRFTGEDRPEPIISTRQIQDRQGNPIDIPIFQKFGTGQFQYSEITSRTEHISLDKIEDYYSFKDDPIAFLQKRGYYNISNIQYQKDITIPRNLAPAKVAYEYDNKTGHHYSNIYDHWRLASLFKGIYYIKNSDKLSNQEITRATEILNKAINDSNSQLIKDAVNKITEGKKISNVDQVINLIREYYNPELAFREIKDGSYIDENGNNYAVSNLQNTAAEIIMSNIYKSAFNIKNGDSLVDVISKGANYFLDIPKTITSDNFDLAFTRNNGKHLYITFKPIPTNSDSFDSSKRAWKNTIRRREVSGDVVNRVFATTDDNIVLFEVGREVIRRDVRYDQTLKKFTQDGKVLSNQSKYRVDGNNVLEYIEFVSNNIVSEARDGKTSRYRLYNINKGNIIRTFTQREYTKQELQREGYTITPEQKFDEEVNNYISGLLADIYNSSTFTGLQVNSSLSGISGDIVNGTLYNLGERLKYDRDLSNYIKSIKTDILDKTKPNPKTGRLQIKQRKLDDKLREHIFKLASKKYASFLKSQSFTVSRIPAQTLQSFMQMKNVGFTGTSTGQCFVSHWQTWLQGSDYDIDKAYVMGLSFDGNGKYVGWSSLFDHSTLETIQESEYLPYPKKMLYDKASTGYNLNNYKIQKKTLEDNIKLLRTELDNSEISEERRNELLKQIEEEEQKLKNVGLDINSQLLGIKNLEDNIFTSEERIKEINSTIRQASPKERTILLNERNQLNQQINQNRRSRMRALAKLLNDINSVSSKVNNKFRANLYYTVEGADKIVQELRDHEFTDIPKGLQEDANKNFISSHIQNTVQDLANMVRAYSPIEMEDFRSASDLSEKGEQASKMTMLNPATKMLMQYSNMTGKNVIGISANGIKASFMWNYYLNEILRSNPTEQDLAYATFDFKLNRVVGRADGKIVQKEINTLPDINFHGVDPIIKARMGNQLKGLIPTDLMSSQVLSAATDNAKELILAKVNAGNKFAKMYLFLISLGVDVRDIVKFMTSDVASFIDQITEENIFENSNISVYDAIEMAKGNFDSYVNKYGKVTINELKELYNFYGLGTAERLTEDIQDATEFKNILEGADEFSRFGQLLGLNQGLSVSEIDLRSDLEKIQNIMLLRAKEVQGLPEDIQKRVLEPIDAIRWLSDSAYRDELKALYNHIKKCINIFDVYDKISQFDAIREIFDAVVTIDNNLTIKTKAYIKLLNKAKQDSLYMPEQYKTRLLNTVDNAIITKFILGLKDIKLPVVKGSNYLTSDGDINQWAKDGELRFGSKSDIASFKYIFENIIIPNLKRGITQNYVNGKVVETQSSEILSNQFIQALLKASYRDVPLYKVNLNMLTIEDSTESQRKFQIYTKGLQELSNKYINGVSISDWFILYNIAVNKNQYGADRLTTLFDKFVTTNQSVLINRYFKWLGDLDFFGEVQLDTDNPRDFETDYYKNLKSKGLLLEISYRDSLASAASIVSSHVGQRDPYIKVNTEQGTVLMKKNGRSYEIEEGTLKQKKGESIDHYLDRVNNYNQYFVLGENFSENLSRQIREISNLGRHALDYINDFVQRGILTISKVCE